MRGSSAARGREATEAGPLTPRGCIEWSSTKRHVPACVYRPTIASLCNYPQSGIRHKAPGASEVARKQPQHKVAATKNAPNTQEPAMPRQHPPSTAHTRVHWHGKQTPTHQSGTSGARLLDGKPAPRPAPHTQQPSQTNAVGANRRIHFLVFTILLTHNSKCSLLPISPATLSFPQRLFERIQRIYTPICSLHPTRVPQRTPVRKGPAQKQQKTTEMALFGCQEDKDGS